MNPHIPTDTKSPLPPLDRDAPPESPHPDWEGEGFAGQPGSEPFREGAAGGEGLEGVGEGWDFGTLDVDTTTAAAAVVIVVVIHLDGIP